MALTRTALTAATISLAFASPAAASPSPPGTPPLPPPPAAPAAPAQPVPTPTAPQPAIPPAVTPPPAVAAPTAAPMPRLQVTIAPLSGRRLKVRVRCGADGDITAKSGSRTLAHGAFNCLDGAATRTLKLRGASTKVTVLTRSAGRTVKVNLRLRSSAHASALNTTVGNTCMGSGAGAAAGGVQVLGVDFNTSFDVASKGDTIWWRGYLYTYNAYSRTGRYVDGGIWHSYMLTDLITGSLNGNVFTYGGGGYIGSDEQRFTVPNGNWSYGLILTWTQRAGYRWHWIGATEVFSPAIPHASGYCWF